jgi:signal transduction histidine kinase
MSLRARLILIFVGATVLPLVATWWLATTLLQRSLDYSSTDQLDRLSKVTEQTGRELYQYVRDSLKADATSGRRAPEHRWAGLSPTATAPNPASPLVAAPPEVVQFWESGETERFVLSEPDGDRLTYLVRRPQPGQAKKPAPQSSQAGSSALQPGEAKPPASQAREAKAPAPQAGEVLAWSAPIGPLGMMRISDEYRQARDTVARAGALDLRRGFVYTYVLLAASVWLVSLVLLALMAHHASRPIRQLTAGLGRLAAGDLGVRLDARRSDETGRAIRAFNDMAAQLEHSRSRLVYLTQLASWQLLARKMAHELKNSLTPIRLTLEEIVAGNPGDTFIEQAARIVIDEVESLERRVRAFSEFAAEPPVRPATVRVNAVLDERIVLLKVAHPEVAYNVVLAGSDPASLADEDLLKGILSNLLENAAEAAGPGGAVLAMTSSDLTAVAIEVHDSGPGLTAEALQTLFEPAISFKKHGMGLGLSIARKNALLMGGDIALVEGRLSGAAFRVTLPRQSAASYQLSEERQLGASVSPRNAQSPERHLIADS